MTSFCFFHSSPSANANPTELLPSDQILSWMSDNISVTKYLQSKAATETTVRYSVGLFPPQMEIMGRHVTCNNTMVNLQEYYAEPTWACDNLQIDGLRLPHAYSAIGFSIKSNGCGTYFPQNNMLALCGQLIQSRGIPDAKTFYVVVTNASCDAIPRGILYISDPNFGTHWKLHAAFRGYTISIRCGLLL